MALLEVVAMPARLRREHSVGTLRILKCRARQVEQRHEKKGAAEVTIREEETAVTVRRE